MPGRRPFPALDGPWQRSLIEAIVFFEDGAELVVR